MSYTKTNWVNGGTPAINATNLNKIETGIETAFNKTAIHDRELANIEAVLDIDNQAIANSGKFYDLFDGTNNYSAGILDTTRTQLNGAHVAGGNILTVDSTTGFVAGQEITLQDDTNIEDGVIDSVDSGTQLTLIANLANDYKDNADVYRSNVLISGSKMNFGTWTSGSVYDRSTPVQVINASYLTTGNGGRKLVILTNGYIIACVRNGTTDVRLYKSTDNGATFTLLVTRAQATIDASITTDGTHIYLLYSHNSAQTIELVKYDNAGSVVGSDPVTVDSSQTTLANVSIQYDGGVLYAAWSSKNATRPNSFNIRYSKCTDAGVTWASPTSITTGNSAGLDWVTPSIVVASSKPVIISVLVNGSNYSVVCDRWNGSAWATENSVYDAGAYAQANPSAVVDGAGVIHVTWQGAADGEAAAIRYNTSSDVGATWGTQAKAYYTAGTGAENPSIAVDAANKPHIVFRTTATGAYNIYKIDKISGSWSAATALTTNNSNNADNPSVCSNYTSFTDPICIYKDLQATKVQFRGIFSATTITSLLINKARYNIIPPMGDTTEIASWVQKERESTETDFVVTAFESIVDTAADESYTAMTKSSTYIAANLAEDQFLMSAVTAQEKVTLKIVMTRATTSIAKAITKVLGAIN